MSEDTTRLRTAFYFSVQARAEATLLTHGAPRPRIELLRASTTELRAMIRLRESGWLMCEQALARGKRLILGGSFLQNLVGLV